MVKHSFKIPSSEKKATTTLFLSPFFLCLSFSACLSPVPRFTFSLSLSLPLSVSSVHSVHQEKRPNCVRTCFASCSKNSVSYGSRSGSCTPSCRVFVRAACAGSKEDTKAFHHSFDYWILFPYVRVSLRASLEPVHSGRAGQLHDATDVCVTMSFYSLQICICSGGFFTTLQD